MKVAYSKNKYCDVATNSTQHESNESPTVEFIPENFMTYKLKKV